MAKLKKGSSDRKSSLSTLQMVKERQPLPERNKGNVIGQWNDGQSDDAHDLSENESSKTPTNRSKRDEDSKNSSNNERIRSDSKCRSSPSKRQRGGNGRRTRRRKRPFAAVEDDVMVDGKEEEPRKRRRFRARSYSSLSSI